MAWRLFLCFILAGLSGCEMKRVLTLKKDGSGQIAEHYVVDRDFFDKDNTLKPYYPDVRFASEQAAKFGRDVTLDSFQALQTKDTVGYDAVYAFKDIGKISAAAFLATPGENSGTAGKTAPPFFKFTQGETSELVIPETGEKAPESSAQPAPAGKGEVVRVDEGKAKTAINALAKRLNIRMAIQVEGEIVETNAPKRAGQEVVLHEMNVKGLAADVRFADYFKDDKRSLSEAEQERLRKEAVDYMTSQEGEYRIRFK